MVRVKLTRLFVAAWWFVATISLGYAWYFNPDCFPPIPELFAIWLTDLFFANTAEQVGTVGLFFGMICSAVFVSVITLCVFLLWKRIQKSRRADSIDC